MAIIYFVFCYSQTHFLKFISNARIYSHFQRPVIQENILKQHEEEVLLIHLEGYLFFGFGAKIFSKLKKKIQPMTVEQVLKNEKLSWKRKLYYFFYTQAPEKEIKIPNTTLKYIILDFTHVTGIDSTCCTVLKNIAGICASQGIFLAFSCVPSSSQKYFDHYFAEDKQVRFFATLGDAVEWSENRILLSSKSQWSGTNYDSFSCSDYLLPAVTKQASTSFSDLRGIITQKPSNLAEAIKPYLSSHINQDEGYKKLDSYFVKLNFSKGDVLFQVGQDSNYIYFINSGKLSAYLPSRNSKELKGFKIFSLSRGSFVGETSFILNEFQFYSLIADSPVSVLQITKENLQILKEKEPDLAYALLQSITSDIGARMKILLSNMDLLSRTTQKKFNKTKTLQRKN